MQRVLRYLGAFLLLAMFNTYSGQASDGKKSILAFGDSLTHGYGLWQGDGFVPQLQDWLDRRGHSAIIINGGVSGDTTAAGRSRLGWSLADNPDAVILALGGNDVLRGLPTSQARENLAAMLSELQRSGLPVLMVGITAPANFGPAYQAEFRDLYEDLAAEFEVLFYEDFLQSLTTDTDVQVALELFFQDDGVHPNAEGVKRIVADIGPIVEVLIDQVDP